MIYFSFFEIKNDQSLSKEELINHWENIFDPFVLMPGEPPLKPISVSLDAYNVTRGTFDLITRTKEAAFYVQLVTGCAIQEIF